MIRFDRSVSQCVVSSYAKVEALECRAVLGDFLLVRPMVNILTGITLQSKRNAQMGMT